MKPSNINIEYVECYRIFNAGEHNPLTSIRTSETSSDNSALQLGIHRLPARCATPTDDCFAWWAGYPHNSTFSCVPLHDEVPLFCWTRSMEQGAKERQEG